MTPQMLIPKKDVKTRKVYNPTKPPDLDSSDLDSPDENNGSDDESDEDNQNIIVA
jgi:hypothetical protein